MFYSLRWQTMSIESNGSNELEITRVPMVRREPPTQYEGRYAEPITTGDSEIEKLWELSTAEKLLLAWHDLKQNTTLVVQLTPILFTTIRGYMFKDWKTTLAGIVKTVFMLLTFFGVSTGNVTEAIVTAAVYGIAELVQAWYTPDNK
jgi:hypothetical protein